MLRLCLQIFTFQLLLKNFATLDIWQTPLTRAIYFDHIFKKPIEQLRVKSHQQLARACTTFRPAVQIYICITYI